MNLYAPSLGMTLRDLELPLNLRVYCITIHRQVQRLLRNRPGPAPRRPARHLAGGGGVRGAAPADGKPQPAWQFVLYYASHGHVRANEFICLDYISPAARDQYACRAAQLNRVRLQCSRRARSCACALMCCPSRAPPPPLTVVGARYPRRRAATRCRRTASCGGAGGSESPRATVESGSAAGEVRCRQRWAR